MGDLGRVVFVLLGALRDVLVVSKMETIARTGIGNVFEGCLHLPLFQRFGSDERLKRGSDMQIGKWGGYLTRGQAETRGSEYGITGTRLKAAEKEI